MSEDGEFSDTTNVSEEEKDESSSKETSGTKPNKSLKKSRKEKKKSKYSLLEKKFDRFENMMTRVLENLSSSPPAAQRRTETNSGVDFEKKDDVLSLFPSDESETEKILSESEVDNDQNLSASAKHCLYDIFGEDALVKKKSVKVGICLDNAQLEVLKNSFRCEKPNSLTAFNEENIDMFPVEESCEKDLKVPSLDDLVDACLSKRYGQKASFAKNKGKVLFTQPCKMVDKICFKGQHAARMGLIMQCYMQQGLGSLLNVIQADEFDKEATIQKVKDIFAISTKVLDQLGRAGAFHHIARRAVTMTDTGLYEQQNNYEFTNLPLSGEGLFGPGLETLLRTRKEKKKQVDDLIPDVRRTYNKRKATSELEANKRPRFESHGKSAQATATQSYGTNWNNFRIPKYQQKANFEDRFKSRARGSYGSFPRRQEQSYGRGRTEKPADK